MHKKEQVVLDTAVEKHHCLLVVALLMVQKVKIIKRKSSFKAEKYIVSHLVFSFFERPFLLFGLLGGGTFFGGLILGIYVVYLRYTDGLNPNRPLMSLVVLMVLGGIFLLSFGLIGMQINDLRKEIYRIQSKISKKE